MLLDSNIIIYAAMSEHVFLRDFIARHNPSVSCISYIEVLGYPGLTTAQRSHFDGFFKAAHMLFLSQEVVNMAATLRQRRKMTLGDAIVASTAIVHNLSLVTRNVADFQWIEELDLLNPFDTL